jgi:valyl-tRNA synthetase
MTAAWPGIGPDGRRELPALPRDPAAEAEIEALMRLVTQVRWFRSDQGLRPSAPVPAMLAGIGDTLLAGHEAPIRSLLRLAPPGPEFAPTASVQAEGVTVQLDTAAAIDLGAERRRLEKDLSAARSDVIAAERKLANPSFIERAPEAVVNKNRERLAAAQTEIARLEQRLAGLPSPD